MKNHLITGIILMIFSCFRMTSQTVSVSVHDTTFVKGSVVDLPVYVDEELDTYQVSAYRLQLEFDTQLMEVLGVVTNGTVSQPLGEALMNVSPPGKVTIGAAGTSYLSGKGIFIIIRLRMLQTGGCYMNFTGKANNYLNEGSPSLTLNYAWVSVTAAPSITLHAEYNSIAKGDSLQLWVWGGEEPYSWSVSDANIASISANGMLQAKATGKVTLKVEDARGIKDSVSNFIIRPFKLMIPGQLKQWAGKYLEMPVHVTDLTESNISSGSFSLYFNSDVLEWVEYNSVETLLANKSVVVNSYQNGLNVSFASAQTITGSGLLLILKFMVKNTGWQNTSVEFTDVIFNENILPSVENGYFSVQQFDRLYIYPDQVELLAGDSIQLQVGYGYTNPLSWTVNNTALATISETGMLKATKGGKVLVAVTDSTGSSGNSYFNLIDTRVALADTNFCVGEMVIRYPVIIQKVPDADPVISMEMTVEFDTTRLQFNGLSYENTVCQGWMHTTNVQQNRILYASSGANAITQTGSMVYFDFQLKQPEASPIISIVHLQNIRMNEGNPVVNPEAYGNIFYKDKPPTPFTVWGDTLIHQYATTASFFVPQMPEISEYVWILPEGLYGNSNDNMIQVTLDAGFRNGIVNVYGINACGKGEKLEFSVRKEDDTGLEANSLEDLSCYPNPVKDKLHIRSADLHGRNNLAVLYDLTGRYILSVKLYKNEHELDVSELLTGVYVLKVISGEQVKHINIVKE
ncbi:MAG: cohesin domain-containing protein [Paludibacter sp.]|nr:cohesin domain-containing protein [Paludibacter sp.]